MVLVFFIGSMKLCLTLNFHFEKDVESQKLTDTLGCFIFTTTSISFLRYTRTYSSITCEHMIHTGICILCLEQAFLISTISKHASRLMSFPISPLSQNASAVFFNSVAVRPQIQHLVFSVAFIEFHPRYLVRMSLSS